MKKNQNKKVNQLSILNFVKVVPKQNIQEKNNAPKLESIDIATDSEISVHENVV